MFYIKESLKLTNKYIILATPLILFSLLSSLYILFSMNGTLLSMVFAFVLFFLMLTTFLSGWFFMVKKCVQGYSENDSNSLIKEFPSGVGEYFLPIIGGTVNTIFLSVMILTGAYFLGLNSIGELGIPAESFSKAMESTAALKTFLLSLSQEQLLKVNAWNFLLMGAMSFVYFILMFYSPVIFFKEKNPYKALFMAIRDLFAVKFFKNICLYIILIVSYFILSVFTTVFANNVFMHFIFTLINFYYLVFVVVLVFNYYYKNYIRIGSNIDETV